MTLPMQTIQSRLQPFMRLAAVAGIVAFLSFPAGPYPRAGSAVAGWLDTLIGYAR